MRIYETHFACEVGTKHYQCRQWHRQLSWLRVGSQMQGIRGSIPRLGGSRVRQLQASGGIGTLQSRASSGLQSTMQGIPSGPRDSSESNTQTCCFLVLYMSLLFVFIFLVNFLLFQPQLRKSCFTEYGRFSYHDFAKSGLGSKRILNVKGGFSQRTVQFFSAAFPEFRLKGSWFVGSWYEIIIRLARDQAGSNYYVYMCICTYIYIHIYVITYYYYYYYCYHYYYYYYYYYLCIYYLHEEFTRLAIDQAGSNYLNLCLNGLSCFIVQIVICNILKLFMFIYYLIA